MPIFADGSSQALQAWDMLHGNLLLHGWVLTVFIFGYRTGAREAAGLLPLGAVLAGRMLASRVAEVKLVPALAAVLAVYGLSLAYTDSKAALPSPDQPLASFLLKKHLTYGLSISWYSSNVHSSASGGLVRERWNTKGSWYGPRSHDATFAIVNPCVSTLPARLFAQTGRPSAIYHVDGFTVLVWRHANLLASHPRPAHHVAAGPARGSPANRDSAAYRLVCS